MSILTGKEIIKRVEKGDIFIEGLLTIFLAFSNTSSLLYASNP